MEAKKSVFNQLDAVVLNREAILAYELTFKSMKDKILVELIEQSRQGSTDDALRRLETCMDSAKKTSEKDSKISKLKERVLILEE